MPLAPHHHLVAKKCTTTASYEADTHIVTQPERSTTAANTRIPRLEVGQSNLSVGGNHLARIARGHYFLVVSTPRSSKRLQHGHSMRAGKWEKLT